ncbi:hypothetical protein PRUPE_6G334300 [Prunus persica]|uniref:Secreted protein n=1 Tax=Prunus persica TaxID=3760 RepID=A0A251NZA7_PRUPE|nr:hypothetical protein PRUPE_6G334300 [Prunus persica]
MYLFFILFKFLTVTRDGQWTPMGTNNHHYHYYHHLIGIHLGQWVTRCPSLPTLQVVPQHRDKYDLMEV